MINKSNKGSLNTNLKLLLIIINILLIIGIVSAISGTHITSEVKQFLVNKQPVIQSVTITPSNPNTSSTLDCSFNITDADPDAPFSVNVSWYNGSSHWTSDDENDMSVNNNTLTHTTATGDIESIDILKGETWTCTINVYDGYEWTGWENSSSVTINNSLPEKVILSEPTNGNTTMHDRTPLFKWSQPNDDDSDILTYQINLTTLAGGCHEEYTTGINNLNYSPSNELCTADEMGGNQEYFWKVRACDNVGCGEWSDEWNFSIEPWVVINITNDNIDFGSMNINAEDDTTDDNPLPFELQNDGNVICDLINVSGNKSLWQSVGLGNEYLQIKAGNTSENLSFNWSDSVTEWANLTSTNQTIIKGLDYNNSRDSAQLEVKVRVPSDEPPGSKVTWLVFTWEQAP